MPKNFEHAFPLPCLNSQFLRLLDSAGGLEEHGFQWSSPETVNPDGLETEESKTEGGAFNRVRRFHFAVGITRREQAAGLWRQKRERVEA